MLIYHPIHDINHCIYRVLRLLEISEHDSFSSEQLRLLDFYSLFPHLLKSITPFPQGLRAYKKIVGRIPDAYEAMTNHKRIFHEMMPIQNTAIHNLIARDLISSEQYLEHVISRTETQIPETLSEKIKLDTIGSEDWYLFLVNELPLIDFHGKKGLKSRTDLMEYRYDG
ncbi:MAG: ABC-three component system middle component 5 [Pontibacterium sp.]